MPFTVQIDTAEQYPYTFDNLAGAKIPDESGYETLDVPTVYESLGRHPNSRGDYGIFGKEGAGVERKSLSDCRSTVLGFGNDRRERFESELANLEKMNGFGLVVVEGEYDELLRGCEATTNKTTTENRRILERSIISFQQRFSVAWHFASSRRSAERYTLRWLQRFWKTL